MADFIADKKGTYKIRPLPTLPSRKKKTFKGLVKAARASRCAGKKNGKVRRQLFRVTIYKCLFCKRLEKTQGNANQHMRRAHLDPKHYKRYDQGAQGHKCQVKGCDRKSFADPRGLKTHYLNRTIHSIEDLLEAQIDVWSIDGITAREAQCAAEWLGDKGLIIRVHDGDSDDEDYVE